MYPYGDVLGKKNLFVCDPCNPFHTIQTKLEAPKSIQLPSFISQNIMNYFILSSEYPGLDISNVLKFGVSEPSSQNFYVGENNNFISFSRPATQIDIKEFKFSGGTWKKSRRISYLWKQTQFGTLFKKADAINEVLVGKCSVNLLKSVFDMREGRAQINTANLFVSPGKVWETFFSVIGCLVEKRQITQDIKDVFSQVCSGSLDYFFSLEFRNTLKTHGYNTFSSFDIFKQLEQN